VCSSTEENKGHNSFRASINAKNCHEICKHCMYNY